MAATAASLISRRVVEGKVEDRLPELAARVEAVGATHCSVVEDGVFSGVIRLGDLCRYSEPGRRILGDLVAGVHPMRVRATEPAESVTRLFREHQLYEAVVVDDADRYVGIATAESVLAWALEQLEQQNRLLQTARQELQVATTARDSFIRALSHDLRTPLNPVLMVASDGASNMDYSPEVREQFQLITIHALLEAQMIDRLLETGMAEREIVRLVTEPCDLRAIIHSVVDQVHELHPLWSIVLNDDAGSAKLSVDADAQRLSQAFRNIFHYLFQESAVSSAVEVRLAHAADPTRILFSFSRRGFGLTRMQLARAFETGREQTGMPTSAREHLSLGLSFAHAVVALHRGYLDIDSEGPGQGIRIEVALPLSAVAAQKMSPGAPGLS